MASPELSLQLYSVREALDADLGGTLDRLAAIGLRNVEAFGFLGRAAELRAALDSAGLRSPSGHAPFLSDRLGFGDSTVDVPPAAQVFDDALTVGVELLIDPMVAPDRWYSRDEVVATADRLNGLVDQAAERGLRIGYHNHSHEFHKSFDGVTAYETFMGLLDPRVVLEVDVFWAATGGQDVVALLGRLGDRVRLLHAKDGIIGIDPFLDLENFAADKLDQRVAGSGEVGLEAVLAAAPAAEYAAIEFDRYDGDLFQAIADSAAYLRSVGVR
ncbi:sugar phosphate isomerase/epimerase family protein [Microbacterium sp.]|uniref:sugar phosphate isomerase/epimerase family protein n=1 Tax=Microbacterium sp. TaxID=51671 RepID=UPI0039E57F34